MANGQSADENHVSRTSSSCVSSAEPHSAQASGVVSDDGDVTVGAVPRGNTVSPPELARDAPGTNVLEVGEHHLALLLRRAANAPGLQRLDRRLDELGHLDPPLEQNERLDPIAGTVAEADRVPVRLALLELVVVAQPLDDTRVGLVLREPGELAGLLVHASVEPDHHRLGESVCAADLPVERVVTGRDLEGAGAERGIDALVRDHTDEA